MSPGGRPVVGKERKQRHQVMLEPRIAAKLRKLGKGNLSRGIAVAVERLSGSDTGSRE